MNGEGKDEGNSAFIHSPKAPSEVGTRFPMFIYIEKI
jgi:hypothetical protein